MRAGRRRRIVWVASYPKSGSTWMRMLLANFLSDSGEAVSINDLGEVLPGTTWFGLADFDDRVGVSPGECTSGEAETLLPRLYRERAARAADGGRLLFCKTHDVPRDTPAGEPLFPEDVTAGAVYLVRNPLDVAVSWAFYTGNDRELTSRGGSRKQAGMFGLRQWFLRTCSSVRAGRAVGAGI